MEAGGGEAGQGQQGRREDRAGNQVLLLPEKRQGKGQGKGQGGGGKVRGRGRQGGGREAGRGACEHTEQTTTFLSHCVPPLFSAALCITRQYTP